MRSFFILLTVFLTACFSQVFGEPLEPVASVEFLGGVKAPEDISAIGKLGALLVIGADEAVGEDENQNIIQFMEQAGDNSYKVSKDLLLFEGNEDDGMEMDIEGIAVSGDLIYVIGSHSAKRTRIKESEKYETNREALRDDEISPEKNRGWLYRAEINDDSDDQDVDGISLRDIIKDDDVLKTFFGLPSKENGVDIEGIGAKGDSLYLGFRGPVLRGNWAPVMKLEFEDPEKYELLFVNLGGRGIRGITSVSDGFLLIAGPVGDGPTSYELYHWDGKDMIPGEDRDPKDVGKLILLGEIEPPMSVDPPARAKAEGIVNLLQQGAEYDLIVVYDSGAKGAAQRFRVMKP